ncbi:MAG: SDR family NAD(P)-dependent oxidoreductase [Asticcacaulis sp.]
MSKVVLITGASGGIGEATARRLIHAGHRVYATARDIRSLTLLEAEGAKLLRLDVTDPVSAQAAVAAIAAAEGRIDILVNNAGYSQIGAIETLPLERIRTQFETNVFGLLHLTQQVLPVMRAQGVGRIVNISSIVGRLTFPGAGAYAASKHALEAFSDALRFELSGFGIDVVLIEPGLIRTRFTKAVEAQAISDADDVYADFNRQVRESTVGVYESGLLSRLGGEGDDVARVIERAINARRPRTRYAVTASAHLFLGLRRLLPDRLWDKVLRGTYRPPNT